MAKIKIIEFIYESENVKDLEDLIMSCTKREEKKLWKQKYYICLK